MNKKYKIVPVLYWLTPLMYIFNKKSHEKSKSGKYINSYTIRKHFDGLSKIDKHSNMTVSKSNGQYVSGTTR